MKKQLLDEQIVSDWRTLMTTQRDMVCQYIIALGNGVAEPLCVEIRGLLAMQAAEVEALRSLIPGLPPEPY
jgi:hypothetical protein